jgi:hypothetical protein
MRTKELEYAIFNAHHTPPNLHIASLIAIQNKS